MHKYTLLLLIGIGALGACSKESPTYSSNKLYTRSLDEIKKTLLGSWDVKSDCNISYVGVGLVCRDTKNESLVFSDTDSLFSIKDGEIIKKDKIEFIRVKSPDGHEYRTDSIYIFKFAKDERKYFPYEVIHDSLIIRDALNSPYSGFKMILKRKK